MDERQRAQAVATVAKRLGREDGGSLQVLAEMWDAAFEAGRLAALDELQDRFCVCMK